MKTSFVYFEIILRKLAESYCRTFTLDELAVLLFPAYNVLKTFTENISAKRENQVKLLNALILLEYQGYIVLNPATDESSITLKGMIKINNMAFCN